MHSYTDHWMIQIYIVSLFLRCPVCEDGEEPIWIDQKCVCRKRENCGVSPVCVTGRRGPQCNQPDCRPCQGIVNLLNIRQYSIFLSNVYSFLNFFNTNVFKWQPSYPISISSFVPDLLIFYSLFRHIPT